MICVFAGNWKQYSDFMEEQDWQLYNAKYVTEWTDIPATDFAFFEVGTYGNNKAWKFMREQYGFTEDERNKHHRELISFIKANYPETAFRHNRPGITSFHNRVVLCPHTRLFNQSRDEVNIDIDSVEMVTILNEHDVILGKVGRCKTCGTVYYSLKSVVNNTPDKFAMLSQIATECTFSFKEVEQVFKETNDIIKTELLLQLSAISTIPYTNLLAPQFSMSMEGIWKKQLWLKTLWKRIRRWSHAWILREYKKDSNR